MAQEAAPKTTLENGTKVEEKRKRDKAKDNKKETNNR